MKPLLKTILCWLALLAVMQPVANRAQAAGPLAIQNATIITISGDTIEGGTILIENGKITAVGKDVTIPGEARVIDGTGKFVMPGFVDAHNAAAMSQANERNEIVPFLSVVDSIDPSASYFEECRRNGITSAAVVPGNSTLIGGKAAILKTAGQYVDDMLLVREAGLKLSLRPASANRMSQMARLRKELDTAKKSIEADAEKAEKADSKSSDSETAEKSDEKDAADKKDGEDKSADEDKDEEKSADEKPEDAGLTALKQVLKGEMPVYIYCENGMDVVAADKIVKDYGLKPIMVLGRDCYRAADFLSKMDQTVILDPTLVFWRTDERTRKDEKIIVPELMMSSEVPFIFQIDNNSGRQSIGSSFFWYQAATAIKYGMSEADALKATTLAPAKLLGIDNMVGSIEVGKDADIVILTGNPLDIQTWVEQTIIDGEVVYDRSQDEKLERLLSPAAE